MGIYFTSWGKIWLHFGGKIPAHKALVKHRMFRFIWGHMLLLLGFKYGLRGVMVAHGEAHVISTGQNMSIQQQAKKAKTQFASLRLKRLANCKLQFAIGNSQFANRNERSLSTDCLQIYLIATMRISPLGFSKFELSRLNGA